MVRWEYLRGLDVTSYRLLWVSSQEDVSMSITPIWVTTWPELKADGEIWIATTLAFGDCTGSFDLCLSSLLRLHVFVQSFLDLGVQYCLWLF